jgi:hypothetical protein
MTEALAAHRETGLELGTPYLQVLLAEGYAREGGGDEGLSILAEALSSLRRGPAVKP